MKTSKSKNSLKDFMKKLNEIDINETIASLQNINLDDLKNIDIKKISSKVKESSLIKPAAGIISAGLLFAFILLPSIETLISKFNQSKQYQLESKNLEFKKKELKKRKLKINQLSILMSELNDSILSEDKLIFVTKLINETAIKSNVKIISFIPIESAKSAKLCKQSNDRKLRVKKRKLPRNNLRNAGPFKQNFYEINLKSDYLNIIEFLNIIQNYDVTIITQCIDVSAGNLTKPQSTQSGGENPTTIIPLSKSGKLINSPDEIVNLKESSYYGVVDSRLVIKIPSHSR
tara:strand:+ start:4621 stop:5487 length:867 start_codon:yes stop_codon:yes gene_type:complete